MRSLHERLQSTHQFCAARCRVDTAVILRSRVGVSSGIVIRAVPVGGQVLQASVQDGLVQLGRDVDLTLNNHVLASCRFFCCAICFVVSKGLLCGLGFR